MIILTDHQFDIIMEEDIKNYCINGQFENSIEVFQNLLAD